MTTIGGVDLTSATIAAFGALLVYDVFFVTLDQEVNLFWPTPWKMGKILFFLNRYLPFCDTFLSLHLLIGNNTDRSCLLGFRAVTWLIVVGIVIAEIILMIRTSALWGNSRFIKYFLIVMSISVFVPAFVVTQIEVMSFAYASTLTGCVKTKHSSPIIFIGFLLLIICETTIVALTLLRARRHHSSQELRSSFVRTIYRDGLIYYIFILAFSIVNVVIAVAAPPSYANWLTTPQRVFHSLLCTRVLIHIRQHAGTGSEDSAPTGTLMSLAFTPAQFEAGSGITDETSTAVLSGGTSTSASGSGSSPSTSSRYQSLLDAIGSASPLTPTDTKRPPFGEGEESWYACGPGEYELRPLAPSDDVGLSSAASFTGSPSKGKARVDISL